MVVFVDAYNVLKGVQGIDYISPQSAQDFIRKAQRRAQQRGYGVVMVFDGGEGRRSTTHVQDRMKVVHAGSLTTADDVLVDYIEGSMEALKVLVTADRSLRKRGMQHGAQPVDPITYWRSVYTEDEAVSRAVGPVYCRVEHLPDSCTLKELERLAFSESGYQKSEEYEKPDRRSRGYKMSKKLKKFCKIKDLL